MDDQEGAKFRMTALIWKWFLLGSSSGCGKDSESEGENDIEIVKKSAGKGVWGQMSTAVEKENLKSQTQYVSIIYFFSQQPIARNASPFPNMTLVIPHITNALSPSRFQGK